MKEQINSWINQIASWLTHDGVVLAENIVLAVLIVFGGMFLISMIRKALNGTIAKSPKLNGLLGSFLVSVVIKLCWAMVALTALQRLGVNVGPIIAGLGVTGFILGFAFQESLGSLAAGMMIAFNQPFKVGDYIIAGGIEGTVTELNMMATVFASADNKKITVPNKAVWGSAITNFSALGKRRVDTCVGVAYDCDVKKAIAVATEALTKVPGVLIDPAPSVSIASLADSAVVLNVRPWSTCADYWAVYSGAQQAVKDALTANGISIPFPQCDVHLIGTKS